MQDLTERESLFCENTIVRILPSKLQWKRWSLPSKVSYLAFWVAVVGVLVAVFLGKSADQLDNSSITGDVVGGDKIVYQFPVAPTEAEKEEETEKRIQSSKIRINRLIDDFGLVVDSIEQEYLKENKRIASRFSSRGMLRSGTHITAQMDYARSTRDRIEKLLTTLHRNIEDILFENFGITTLEENDNFVDEASRLAKEKERVRSAYRLFENTVKKWDEKCSGNTRLTQNFRL